MDTYRDSLHEAYLSVPLAECKLQTTAHMCREEAMDMLASQNDLNGLATAFWRK
jgi:hypothetical protein